MASGASLTKILSLRYKQFGGLRVVRHYAKMGILLPMCKQIIANPFNRRSYKKAYSLAVKIVEPYLVEKYSPLMRQRAEEVKSRNLEHQRSKIVWFSWLQGIEQAPPVIKVCMDCIIHNLPDREVKVIDADNWKDYVDLPDYVIQKWEKKVIPSAHFSDLIRLQLLIRYGGTWMDSTVLCTGLTEQNEDYTKPYLDSDLFLFQYTKPGSNQWGGIGNWFITACSNNEVLVVLRDMLLAYWKEYDCLLDYYIFHLFFSMLREEFPKEIGSMPNGYAVPSITLVHHWGEKYDKEKWDRFVSKVCFHKLTYIVKPEVLKEQGNYYNYIVDGGAILY